jgi:hypothetical protein
VFFHRVKASSALPQLHLDLLSQRHHLECFLADADVAIDNVAHIFHFADRLLLHSQES